MGEPTPTDDLILSHVTDVYLDQFTYCVSADEEISEKKLLRVGYRLNFQFENNDWIEENNLWVSVKYLYSDPYNSPVVKAFESYMRIGCVHNIGRG